MDLSINPETSNRNEFNLGREDHANISQHFENAPQVVNIYNTNIRVALDHN